jgi:hypothetical protein
LSLISTMSAQHRPTVSRMIHTEPMGKKVLELKLYEIILATLRQTSRGVTRHGSLR